MRIDKHSRNKGISRLFYFTQGFLNYYFPHFLKQWCWKRFVKKLSNKQKQVAQQRAAYYCNLKNTQALPTIGQGTISPEGKDFGGLVQTIAQFRYPWHQKRKFATYFFDLFPVVSLFPKQLKFAHYFGDVNFETPYPAFVKTRPIQNKSTTSVLMKLNSVRHFRFVHDEKPWICKQNRILFRNIVNNQPWRTNFIAQYHQHPMCDVGQVNHEHGVPASYVKPFMPIEQQLDYRFIMCIEGNDVATNLKWVMSSNSLAVMPKPKFESWFMEGTLVPDVHYICVKPDYSDLIDKVTYYANHPVEAQKIVEAAHRFVAQFQDKQIERYTKYLVAQTYFSLTNPQE